MNPTPIPTRFALALAWAQLALAVTALTSTLAHVIRVEMADFFGQWDRLPAPLLTTGSAIAAVVLMRRARFGAAMTAALLPAAAHVLVTVQRLPVHGTVPFGPWKRQALTHPLGQWSTQPYPALARIGDLATMAAIVAGVAVAVCLVRVSRRHRPRQPSPPGWAAVTVMAMAMLAIASTWTGEHLSQGPELGSPAQPTVVVLVAAAVAAMIDAHTRWAARQGMPTVAAASAGASGMVLLVPLGWLLWPLIQQWLRTPPKTRLFITSHYETHNWEDQARGILALGTLLAPAAVALAALTAAHRATAAARRTNDHPQE